MSKLPTVLEKQPAIELTEWNASRPCSVCNNDADYYVFMTRNMVKEETGIELGYGEDPVSDFLCIGCFKNAPRVESIKGLLNE